MGKTIFIIILLTAGIYHQGLAQKLKFAVNGGFNYSFAGDGFLFSNEVNDLPDGEIGGFYGLKFIYQLDKYNRLVLGYNRLIQSYHFHIGNPDEVFFYTYHFKYKSSQFPILIEHGFFIWKQYYLILNAGVAIDIRNKQTITKRVVEDFFNTSYKASTSLANTIGVSLTAGIGVEHTLGKMGTIGIELSGFYGIFNNIIVDLVYTIESDSEPRYLLMRNTSLQMGLRYYPLWQKKKRKQKSQRPWQSPMPASYKKMIASLLVSAAKHPNGYKQR